MGANEARASVQHLSRLIYIGACAVLVAILVVSVIASGYMTRPITQVVQLAQQVSEGDLSVALDKHRISHDEIGILTQTFHKVIAYFREMAAIAANVAQGDLRQKVVPKSGRDTLGYALQDMTTYLQEMAAIAAAFAEGDLRQEVTPRSAHDILGKAFASMDAIRYMIRQMIAGVRQLEEAAGHLIRISADMASGAEETSRQVQAVSANSQQINQNISSVSSAAEEFAARAGFPTISPTWRNRSPSPLRQPIRPARP